MNNRDWYQNIYSNYYYRKRQLININILINENCNKWVCNEKWNLLLQSAIILLNAHYEWFIKDIFQNYFEQVHKTSKIVLYNNDIFYKKDLIFNWFNIEYSSLKEIMENSLWKKSASNIYIRLRKELKYKKYFKKIFQKLWTFDLISNVNIDDQPEKIINNLVWLRNLYWHWYVDISHILKNEKYKKKYDSLLFKDINYSTYYSIYYFTIFLLELIIKEVRYNIANFSYMKDKHIWSFNKILELKDKYKVGVIKFIKNNVDKDNLLFVNKIYENYSVDISFIIESILIDLSEENIIKEIKDIWKIKYLNK